MRLARWKAMRRTAPFVFAVLAGLAACGPDPSRQEPSNDAVTVDIAGPSNQAAPPPNAAPPAQAPPSAPAQPAASADAGRPGFAGLWAVDDAGCKSPPWRFTERDLTTKGEVYCSFKRIDPVAGGYDIAAACAAAGDEVSEVMRLRLKDAGKVMTVSSDETYKPIDLIRCKGN